MSSTYFYEITAFAEPGRVVSRFQTDNHDQALSLVSECAALFQSQRGSSALLPAQHFAEDAATALASAEHSGKDRLSCGFGTVSVLAIPVLVPPATYLVHEPVGSAYWLDGDTLHYCPIDQSGELRLAEGGEVEWTEPEHRPSTQLIEATLRRLAGVQGATLTLTVDLGAEGLQTPGDIAQSVLRSAESIGAGDQGGDLYDSTRRRVGSWLQVRPIDIDADA